MCHLYQYNMHSLKAPRESVKKQITDHQRNHTTKVKENTP